MKISNKTFTVHGEPFMPIGVQVHNSSAYSIGELTHAWKAVEVCKANCIAIPIYWELIEPREGKYDFSLVEDFVLEARKRGVNLFLEWFGTWKNGAMKYVPGWIKKDQKRFKRVITHDGIAISVLSAHCNANLEADKRAFAKLMAFLKVLDYDENTVVAVQVQNESGIMLGAVRDYSSIAQQEYESNLPLDLICNMEKKPESSVTQCWRDNDCLTEDWESAFGDMADEYFTAYAISSYVEQVATAGKQENDLTLYTNVLVEQQRWEIAGFNYPAGGPTANVLDIWKWMAPHLDFIAPDIYLLDLDAYRKCCETYARSDNPLFIPESGPSESNSRYLFEAVGVYGAIGYFLFGAEGILTKDDDEDPAYSHIIGSMKALSAVSGGLLQYRNTGKVRTVLQNEYMAVQRFEFKNYLALAYFINCHPSVGSNDTDWNWHDHYHKNYRESSSLCDKRGRGLIIEIGEHVFYVTGDAFRILFLPKEILRHKLPALSISEYLITRNVDYQSVEEGEINAQGKFVPARSRNGDESDFGIWVEPDVGVVRVCLNDYQGNEDF